MTKYRRFSRGRKSMFCVSNKKNKNKKSEYMFNTDGSKMLDSGFYENQVWGALHKAWERYIILWC
jgi:hypothetical protein